jgi:replicative DNA helicase
VRKAIETFNLPGSVAVKFQKSKSTPDTGKTSEVLGRDKFEMAFLSFLFSNPEFIADSLRAVKPDYFRKSIHQEVYAKLEKLDYAKYSVGDFLEMFPDNGNRRKITEIIVTETDGVSSDVRFAEFISSFNKFHISDRLADIRAAMENAEKEGEQQILDQLTREYLNLSNVANTKGG